MPCARPDLLEFASVADLYLRVEELFLNGHDSCSHQIQSSCGHLVTIFDHHFFHLVKLQDPSKTAKLLMQHEKSIIRATTVGFGNYSHHPQRAKYLPPAFDAICNPDEMWEIHEEHRQEARWFYVKEFDKTPYTFHLVFMAERENEGIVPVTHWPAKPKEIIKRQGKGVRLFPA